MKLIFDSEVRKIISLYLKKNKFKFNTIENGQENLNLKEIDGICSLIYERYIDSKKEAKKNLSRELSLAYLGVMTLGILCLCIDEKKNENEPINSKWLGKDNPNPNFILQKLLVQLVNYSISVLHLIEAGQNSSTKPIIRSIYELSSLSLVLLMEKNKMYLFLHELDRDNEKKLWRKHFNFQELNSILVKFEKTLGYPDDLLKKRENARNSVYSDYSQSLHNSYTSTILSTFSTSQSDRDMLYLNLFGKYSSNSRQILYDLTYNFFYTIASIQPILEKYHNFKIPEDNYLWGLFSCLRNCYVNAYAIVTYPDELKEITS